MNNEKPEEIPPLPVSLQRRADTLPSRQAAMASEWPVYPAHQEPHLVSFAQGEGIAPATLSDRHMYSMQQSRANLSEGYLPDHEEARPFAHNVSDSALELAPLGHEFNDDEHMRMTRKARRRYRKNSRLGALDLWLRGYKPLFGWCGPPAAVSIGFLLLALLGVALFFVVPRVPSVALLTNNALTPSNGRNAMAMGRVPATFSMNGTLQLRLDNSNGWIPSKLKTLDAVVKHTSSNNKVGVGKLEGKSVPGRKTTVFRVPIAFHYTSLNATGDDVYLAFQAACAHQCTYPALTQTPALSGRVRCFLLTPALDLTVEVTTDVQAVPGTQTSSLALVSYACPWELPN